MANLDKAKVDVADFAKELDLVELGGAKAGTYNSANVEAGVNGVYTIKAKAVGGTGSAINDAGFEGRSATVQDQLITEQKAALATNLTNVEKAAKAGTTALVEAVNAEIEAANTAYEADAKATAAYSEEKGVFAGLNGAITIGDANTDWNFLGNQFGKLTVVAGPPAVTSIAAGDVYAEKVNGVWKLTEAGKTAGAAGGEIKRIEDLAAKYEAAQAAAAAKESAEEALAAAIEAVYLNENGGNSVVATDLANTFSYDVANKTYKVVYTTPVDIYKTADDADAGAGQAQEFSFNIGTAGVAGDSFTFAGQTIAFTSSGAGVDVGTATTAAQQATAIQGLLAGGANDVSADWTVTVVGTDVLKFVAKANEANIATAQMPKATGTLAIAEQAGGKDGVAPGEFISAAQVDAALSQAVANAQIAIDSFDKAVSQFEAIRDIKGDLAELDQAITDATDWFAENDYAAPVILADTDSKNATNKSDVFLISDLEGNEKASIGKFGDKGADYLFVGEDYKLVALDDKTIDKNVGIQTELEIFYKQSGNDLTLYVETEAFGGNLANQAEIVEIILVGKTIDDITLDGSFITAGDAIA